MNAQDFQKLRIGQGYDIHQLVPDRKLILGGVHIPHPLGLLGHSDADCLSHAITDALLGAAGLGDIGHFYPDTDSHWKDVDSQLILREVSAKLSELGWEIINIDATVIAQKPKLATHLPEMKTVLCRSMQIEQGQLCLKATTHEKLDAIGEEKGIASHAVALIYKK